MPEFLLEATAIGFLVKLLGAMIAIAMIGICALVGAWFCGIDIKEAVNRVEENPMAFSIFVTGHFLGAALVVSGVW